MSWEVHMCITTEDDGAKLKKIILDTKIPVDAYYDSRGYKNITVVPIPIICPVTLLHYSVIHGAEKCVAALLQLGANISLTIMEGNFKGKNALQIAQGKHEIVQSLTNRSGENNQLQTGTSTGILSRNATQMIDVKNQPDKDKEIADLKKIINEKDKEIAELKQTLHSNTNEEIGKLQKKLRALKPKKIAIHIGDPSCPWKFSPKMWQSNKWQNQEGLYDSITMTPNDMQEFDLEYNCIKSLFDLTSGGKYTITKIIALRSKSLQQIFERKLFSLSVRKKSSDFQPSWEQCDGETPLRSKIMHRFKKFVVCHSEENIPLIPLWHGTSPGSEVKILSNGYATLASTDPGFFGKGCFYGTPQTEYACRVYGKGILLLNFATVGNVFPVVFSDMPQLFGKNCYKNYDCHYAPVVPKNQDNPKEVNYIALNTLTQKPVFDEFVIFQESQVVPRFAIYYEKMKN